MVFRSTAFLCLFCWIAGAQPASFEGVAENAVTHEPLAGVHIRLISIRNAEAAEFQTYGAMSDRAGRFSISPIRDGSYILTPSLRGFVYTQPKGGALPFPSVTIKSGERQDFKLAMTPAAVIGGRVVDEYGDPVARASVQVEPLTNDFVTGGFDLSGRSPSGTTDDRGMFRIAVAPTKYYVKASLQRGFNSGPPEIRTDGSAPPDYATTYFPSSPAKESAASVEARPGAELTGIDIRLAHPVRSRSFGITGSVTGIPETDNATVMVLFGSKAGAVERSWSTGVRRDTGKFTLTNLEPGFYRLFPMSYGPSGSLQGALVDVTIAGADVNDLELHLAGGGDLTGTVEIAGEPPGTPHEKRTIQFGPAGPYQFGATPSASVDGQGNFRIERIPAGKFRVKIDPLPENAYVQSVTVDGTAAVDGIIDFAGSRGARAKVTISRNGAQIEGTVRDKEGHALANTFAVVMLVDNVEKADLNGNNNANMKQVADGKYRYTGVRPGKYRLVAIDAFQSPDVESPDVLKKAALALPEFEVKEGDRLTKDVTVLGKEDVNAKPKQ